MKAAIQTDTSGQCYNVNAYVAQEGFRALGWEVIPFVGVDELDNLDPEIIVVGGIGQVRRRLKNLGVARPEYEIDYPVELEKYLLRKVWATSLNTIFKDESQWNVFVKPKVVTKKFAGTIVREYKDFLPLLGTDDVEIWCSELVDLVAEWRCFVRYGEVLDVRRYKGFWNKSPDAEVIFQAVNDFKNAPAAYAMDFGIDVSGQMVLIEINDGHSLGSYGIGAINYAKFLSARWAEMTGTEDFLKF